MLQSPVWRKRKHVRLSNCEVCISNFPYLRWKPGWSPSQTTIPLSINCITVGKNSNAGTVRIRIDLFKPRTNKVVKNVLTAPNNSFNTCAKVLECSRGTNIWPIPVAFSFNCISMPLAIFAKAPTYMLTVRQCKQGMFLSHLSRNRNSPASGLKWGDHR